MISLSLSWTCWRDRVSLVKFGLYKNNFITVSDTTKKKKKTKYKKITKKFRY